MILLCIKLTLLVKYFNIQYVPAIFFWITVCLPTPLLNTLCAASLTANLAWKWQGMACARNGNPSKPIGDHESQEKQLGDFDILDH